MKIIYWSFNHLIWIKYCCYCPFRFMSCVLLSVRIFIWNSHLSRWNNERKIWRLQIHRFLRSCRKNFLSSGAHDLLLSTARNWCKKSMKSALMFFLLTSPLLTLFLNMDSVIVLQYRFLFEITFTVDWPAQTIY